MLEFCPVCKNLLMIKEENEKFIGYCNCGFKRTSGISISGEENIFKDSVVGSGFVYSKNSSEGFIHNCSRCGYNQAEVSQIAANESEITVYRCLKCGYSERQSQGSSKA